MAYYLIFVFSGILSFIADFRYKYILCFILAITLSVFAGTRFGIDNDYFMYYKNMRYIEPTIKAFLNRNIALEWCMFVIPQFFKLFFNNTEDVAKASFLLFAVLGVSLKISAIAKYSEFILLSILLYIGNLFLMQEMTTIRAGIAAGIFLWSLKNIENREFLQFFIKILVCLFFHSSSILFIIPWLLFTLKTDIKYYYIFLILSVLLVVFNINILTALMLNKIFPRVQMYIDAMEWAREEKINVFNFKMLFAMMIIIPFSLYYSKMKKIKLFDLLFKTHIISVGLFFVFSVSGTQVFSTRTFEMYSIIQLLLYPMVLFIFPNKTQIIGWVIIFIFSVIQLYFLVEVADIFKEYKSWL